MSKQNLSNEPLSLNTTGMSEKQITRATFLCLLQMWMKFGKLGMFEFMMDRDSEAVKDFEAIWDECAADPIGTIIRRPPFHVYRLNAELKERYNKKQEP